MTDDVRAVLIQQAEKLEREAAHSMAEATFQASRAQAALQSATSAQRLAAECRRAATEGLASGGAVSEVHVHVVGEAPSESLRRTGPRPAVG